MKPPTVACYLNNPAFPGNWLAVAGTSTGTSPYCGLILTQRVWLAVMNRVPAAGWNVAFVLTY